MRIAVVGPGAVGGYFGALLARGGKEVICLARGGHLEAIRERGLRVESVHGQFTVRVHATGDAAAIGPVDVVLFTVKTYDIEAAGRAMLPMVGEGTAIVPLQNGVESAQRVAAVVGPGRVLGGAAYLLARRAAPGLVRQIGGPRRIVFGELDGARTARAEAILALLRAAEINAEVTDRIVPVLWEKWALICAHGGLTAVTRLPIGPVRASAETWAFCRGVVEEVVAVALARGLRLASDLVDTTLDRLAKLEAHAAPSLYHDLMEGCRLELEALHGGVVRYGRDAGVPTPCNRAIYAALKPHEAGRPGSP